MKKILNLLSLVMLVLLITFGTICVEAAFLPIEENFADGEIPAAFTVTCPKEFTYDLTDGNVKITNPTTSSGGKYTEFELTTSLSPYVFDEKVNIYFDYTQGANTEVYTAYGFPAITDASGNRIDLIRFYEYEVRVPGSLNDDNYKIADFTLTDGVTYKFRIELDLEALSYSIYCDRGDGEKMLATTTGATRVALKTNTLSKIDFTAQTGWGYPFDYITLDNIKIVTESPYIYVSPNGDDANDGSKTAPFKTLDKAYEVASAMKTLDNQKVYVMLMGGDYTLDENYTYSKLDIHKNPDKIAFYPVFSEKVRINGDFNFYAPSELNLSDYEREYILDKLETDNTGYYKAHPLTYKNAQFSIDPDNAAVNMSLEVLNTSYYDADVSLFICGYTSNGSLKTVATNDYTVGRLSTDELNISLSAAGVSYIKAFIWDSAEGMKPLHTAFIYEGASSFSVVTLDSSIELSEAYISEGNVIISCAETDKKRITLKITDASQTAIYFDQINLDDATTSFSKSIPLGTTLADEGILGENYILTIRGSY